MKLQRTTIVGLTALAVALFLVDYYTDPVIEVHLFYVILVAAVAVLTAPALAYAIGILLPVLRQMPQLLAPSGSMHSDAITNLAIQIAVMCVAVYLTAKTRQLAGEARMARKKIPICAYCKSVQGPGGDWENIESFLRRQADLRFTNGVCPRCEEDERSARQTVDGAEKHGVLRRMAEDMGAAAERVCLPSLPGGDTPL